MFVSSVNHVMVIKRWFFQSRADSTLNFTARYTLLESFQLGLLLPVFSPLRPSRTPLCLPSAVSTLGELALSKYF